MRTFSVFAHLDAAEGIFLSRALEEVRSKTYDIKYVNLLGRQLIPVDNSVDPGKETIRYEQYEMYGIAKIISDYADDLPRADVAGREFFSVVRTLGASYGYSQQELRAARAAGAPLVQRKADAAKRAVEQAIDRIAQVGDTARNMLGLLNQPNVSTYVIPAGVSGFTDWRRKTPDEIAEDINGAINSIVSNTKGVEIPDTVLLPIEQYTLIATRRMGDGSDKTILDFVLDSNSYVNQIVPWYALNGAGSGGVDRMMVYRRDPDALQLIIPMEFTQHTPQERNLEVVIPCEARIGGVVFYYPMSACYADGI